MTWPDQISSWKGRNISWVGSRLLNRCESNLDLNPARNNGIYVGCLWNLTYSTEKVRLEFLSNPVFLPKETHHPQFLCSLHHLHPLELGREVKKQPWASVKLFLRVRFSQWMCHPEPLECLQQWQSILLGFGYTSKLYIVDRQRWCYGDRRSLAIVWHIIILPTAPTKSLEKCQFPEGGFHDLISAPACFAVRQKNTGSFFEKSFKHFLLHFLWNKGGVTSVSNCWFDFFLAN